MNLAYWLVLIIDIEFVLMDWFTLTGWWIFELVLPCFPLGVKPMFLFDAFYIFEDALLISLDLFISFMHSSLTYFLAFPW